MVSEFEEILDHYGKLDTFIKVRWMDEVIPLRNLSLPSVSLKYRKRMGNKYSRRENDIE